MTSKILRIANTCGRVAAIMLLTGLVFGTASAAWASALTPHVRWTTDTSACAACHSTHSASSPLLLRAADVNGACSTCHGGADPEMSDVMSGTIDSFGLASGHSLSDEATSLPAHIEGCATCHYSHGASSDTRGIPAPTVNGADVSSAGADLCLACHESSSDWFGVGYPSTSSPTRDATGYPVSGTWPGSSTYASSTSGHRLIPESTQTVGVSEPVRRGAGDCLYCHAAHGGPNAYDGLLTTFTVPSQSTLASDQADGAFASLCFNCHGGATPSGFTTAPVDIKQFATASGGSGGHSIVTSGGTLPVGAPLPCFECHNPHGSNRDNASQISDERGGSLHTTSSSGVRHFCFTCHTTGDTPVGWDSTAETYTADVASETVVGLPRDGGVLHLSPVDGHSQEATASCYECHGDNYGPDGHNVHNPGDGTGGTSGLMMALAIIPSADASGAVAMGASVELTGAIDATGAITATDTTPPLTISDALVSYADTATVTLTATDNAGGSGVAETYYSLDGAETATGTVVYVTTPGDHTLTYWSVDNAGNVEPPSVVTFTTGPVIGTATILGMRRGEWILDNSG